MDQIVSVVILFCDDDSSFLERAVSSIKEHIKFSDYEIIAVDNREKDKTPISIEGVKFISKGYNLNCFEGRRFGFENSRGQYIWNFDVDDLMIGDLLKEDIKLGYDFLQMFYENRCASGVYHLEKKHLPRGYGWNVWSRLYSRNILEKVYSKIDKPVNVFSFEDKILFDFVNSMNPTYEYIEKYIYEYNVSNASNTPQNKKKYEELLKTGLEDYEYLYGLIGKPWLAKELKERIERLIGE